jgi:hypothetical protein
MIATRWPATLRPRMISEYVAVFAPSTRRKLSCRGMLPVAMIQLHAEISEQFQELAFARNSPRQVELTADLLIGLKRTGCPLQARVHRPHDDPVA